MSNAKDTLVQEQYQEIMEFIKEVKGKCEQIIVKGKIEPDVASMIANEGYILYITIKIDTELNVSITTLIELENTIEQKGKVFVSGSYKVSIE